MTNTSKKQQRKRDDKNLHDHMYKLNDTANTATLTTTKPAWNVAPVDDAIEHIEARVREDTCVASDPPPGATEYLDFTDFTAAPAKSRNLITDNKGGTNPNIQNRTKACVGNNCRSR